jgi:FdhD protein
MQDNPAFCFEEQKILVYRTGSGFSEETVPVVQETSLRILLNDAEIVTIACNANYPEELAVGFLRAEGFISIASDIRKIEISDKGRCVHVLTNGNTPKFERRSNAPDTIESSGARGWRGKEASLHREDLSMRKVFITTKIAFDLMERFVETSRLHQVTGGTHSAALSDGERILAVREDIGRHNTIDMLGGYALLQGIDCSDKIILRTGRVSAEIVHKVWNLEVPVMISLSVPTSMAVHLCKKAGMTLIGSVRGGKMNVYCHEWRIEK